MQISIFKDLKRELNLVVASETIFGDFALSLIALIRNKIHVPTALIKSVVSEKSSRDIYPQLITILAKTDENRANLTLFEAKIYIKPLLT